MHRGVSAEGEECLEACEGGKRDSDIDGSEDRAVFVVEFDDDAAAGVADADDADDDNADDEDDDGPCEASSAGAVDGFPFARPLPRLLVSNPGTPYDSPHFCSMASMFCV